LEISRIFHDQTEIGELKKNNQPKNSRLVTPLKLRAILRSTKEQLAYAEKLVNALGCPTYLRNYGISNLDAVQAYYDKVSLSF
jgi:hypothetical protein